MTNLRTFIKGQITQYRHFENIWQDAGNIAMAKRIAEIYQRILHKLGGEEQ